MSRLATALLVVFVVGVGCGGHGHDHAAHDDGDSEAATVVCTRWTDTHELFVEIDPPRPSQPARYRAHVTVLDGFRPVTEGSFAVSWFRGDAVAAEVRADRVSRAGIFALEAPGPAAGMYTLRMVYQDGARRSELDCGAIAVAEGSSPAEDPDAAALSFLKEQQWRVPFATAWAQERAMAREVELPAILETPSSDQLTLASPTGGRFFHAPKLALAAGVVLAAGTVVGFIAPTVAGDDFSRLELAVEEARLDQRRAERERQRLAPLVEQGLLPDKRLHEAEAEVATAAARLRSARRRIGSVVAAGGVGGLPIKTPRSGAIAAVWVDNGAPVAPGQPLVQLLGDGPMWARARFVSRPDHHFTGATPVALRVGGEHLELGDEATFLSPLPLVDAATQLSSWMAGLGELAGVEGAASLKPGTAAVLLVRVGAPTVRLAVPESAVTEINTHRYVFVQTEGESFHKRRVVTGARDGGFVEVLEGVRAGERVVTRGAFDIHLSAVMGTQESHRH